MKIGSTDALQAVPASALGSGLEKNGTRANSRPAAGDPPAVAKAARDTSEASAGVSNRAAPIIANYHLSFRFEKDINRVVVQMIDSESGEVIRSIPPEEAVRALQELSRGPGAVLDEEA